MTPCFEAIDRVHDSQPNCLGTQTCRESAFAHIVSFLKSFYIIIIIITDSIYSYRVNVVEASINVG
jgi:hypothetical protein